MARYRLHGLAIEAHILVAQTGQVQQLSGLVGEQFQRAPDFMDVAHAPGVAHVAVQHALDVLALPQPGGAGAVQRSGSG